VTYQTQGGIKPATTTTPSIHPWDESLQKVVRWFLDADDSPDSHQNLIITFWPICNVPWNLHATSFRSICIKSTN